MIKRLTAWHARQGVTAEAALAHWGSRHAELVAAVPGVRGYIQNHCIVGPAGDPGAQPPYTGLGEVWFDDLSAAQAAMATVEWQAVIEDAATFMDMQRLSAAWAEEQVFER